MMQAQAVPPPVVAVGPNGLPASICTGMPEIIRNGTRFCILGLRITGGSEALGKAVATLTSEGWDAELRQISATESVVTVDAKGKATVDLAKVEQRVTRGEFGQLTIGAAAIPLPGQPKQ